MFEIFLGLILTILIIILVSIVIVPIVWTIYIQMQKKKKLKGGLSFPNTITKEEYYERKAMRENDALSDTCFWDKLEASKK